jgi:hypothetical protein
MRKQKTNEGVKMDINQQDKIALYHKRCPDCSQQISNYFFESDRPWCKACDVWFEIDSSGWVIRNQDATYQYKKQWARLNQVKQPEAGI